MIFEHFWRMGDSGEAGVIIKQLTRHSTLRNRSLYEKNACWVGILSGGRHYHYCYCWYGLTFHLADALSNNQWRNKTDKSKLKDQLTELRGLNSNRMLLFSLFSLFSIVASENEVITIKGGFYKNSQSLEDAQAAWASVWKSLVLVDSSPGQSLDRVYLDIILAKSPPYRP